MGRDERNLKKIELLAPAGDFEKLEIAVHYGADAVYLAYKDYSLRNFSGNFTQDELAEAVAFARDHNVKTYIACNIYSRNAEQEGIARHFAFLADVNPDGLIVADPGILLHAREHLSQIPIHLSTQANTTNFRAVQFWAQHGIRRINMARELSLKEISEISKQCPEIEIEAFIHGAMCVSYSGRCLLSSYLTNRDSNRGQCSHPCRWRYALVEETRPGMPLPFLEDGRGSYILAARDVCMINHLPALIAAGVTALKIEGRMKGIHYLATVLNVYRRALDEWQADPEAYQPDPEWLSELHAVDNRGYSTGFYFDAPGGTDANHTLCKVTADRQFAAKIIGSDNNLATLQARNKLFADDAIEILSAGKPSRRVRILELLDASGNPAPFVQPGMFATARLEGACRPMDLIRRIRPFPNEKDLT